MKITDIDKIRQLKNSELSIFLAKSNGCGVCDISKIQLEMLLKPYNITLNEVYIDEVPEFRGEHLVFTVPTVLLFSHNKEILRESRFIDLHKIERIIKLNLN